MEWVAAVVALVSAVAALWQALEARRARRSAQSAAHDAGDHEARAAAAAERMAVALEEQNLRERIDRERYENPWNVTTERYNSGIAVSYRLGGAEAITDVKVGKTVERERVESRDAIPNPMRPGQSFTMTWSQTYASVRQLDLVVSWTRSNGERHEFPFTLP